MQVGIDIFASALGGFNLSVSASERMTKLIEQIEYGLHLEDYDSLFAEKLELLLKIRDNEHVFWSGKYRPSLNGQGIYPRPLQNPFPIWIGVGGTPESFVRAGLLGLPLMVAIIGGKTHRFRPLVDLYRQAGKRPAIQLSN